MKISTKLLVSESIQNGYNCFMGAASAEVLADCTLIDRYDPSKRVDSEDQGYQRPAESARVKAFANFLRKAERFVLPPVILSSRDVDLRYNPASRQIELRGEAKLRIVDGQHRLEGFKYAINEKKLEELKNYNIPFLIISGLDRIGEMNIFRVVNGEAKSVRTDLVNSLLTQLARAEGKDAIEEKDQWKVVATYVVDWLNGQADSPWFDKIVKPGLASYSAAELNAEPALKHRRLIRMTSFTSSLRPVYNYLSEHGVLYGGLAQQGEKMAEFLDAFWGAIRDECPVVFDEGDDYVIQKTAGIFSLHSILRDLLFEMHKESLRWTRENFRREFETMPSIVTPSFWGRDGEAAKYGSMKGFRQLADLLRAERDDANS